MDNKTPRPPKEKIVFPSDDGRVYPRRRVDGHLGGVADEKATDRYGAYGTNPDKFNRAFKIAHGRMPRQEFTPRKRAVKYEAPK